MLLKIYTDGAYSTSRDIGGWAYAVLDNNGNVSRTGCGRELNTTNNRMELMAVIKAINSVINITKDIEIYSDSNYIVKTINKEYNTQSNSDLWEQIPTNINLKGVKVPGHSTDKLNNLVDALATSIIDDMYV